MERKRIALSMKTVPGKAAPQEPPRESPKAASKPTPPAAKRQGAAKPRQEKKGSFNNPFEEALKKL